jgi:hypothetical protein
MKARQEEVRESSLPERVVMSEGIYDHPKEVPLTKQESAINRLLYRRQQELSHEASHRSLSLNQELAPQSMMSRIVTRQ